jgi:hypothetical protein
MRSNSYDSTGKIAIGLLNPTLVGFRSDLTIGVNERMFEDGK